MLNFVVHEHTFVYPSGEEQLPLIVCGYGFTEYEIRFCVNCGEIVWRLTKDIDNLYPHLSQLRKE